MQRATEAGFTDFLIIILSLNILLNGIVRLKSSKTFSYVALQTNLDKSAIKAGQVWKLRCRQIFSAVS